MHTHQIVYSELQQYKPTLFDLLDMHIKHKIIG